MKLKNCFIVLGILAIALVACGQSVRAPKSSVTPAFLVAAADAPIETRQAAHYLTDGIDDQVEINAAIAALPSAGGVVTLSEGTFNYSGNIELTSNLTFQGRGDATILKPSGAFLGIIDGDISNVSLSDFSMEVQSGAPIWAAITFVGAAEISGILVENLTIDANGIRAVGINLQGVTRAVVRNNTIYNFGRDGVLATFSTEVMVEGNNITDSGESGIAFKDTNRVQVRGNTVKGFMLVSEGIHEGGIDLYDNVDDVVITGNILDTGTAPAATGSTHTAIRLGGLSQRIVLADNLITMRSPSGNAVIRGHARGGLGAESVQVSSNVARILADTSYFLQIVTGTSNVDANYSVVNNMLTVEDGARLIRFIQVRGPIGSLVVNSNNVDFGSQATLAVQVHAEASAGSIVVTGNVFIKTTNNVLDIRNTLNLIVTGNRLETMGRWAVVWRANTKVAVVGNIVQGKIGRSGSGASGIEIVENNIEG